MTARPFVALDRVRHVYGDPSAPPAVEDLTLAIGQGEFAAVVGPSGCGKSTLMKLATGLQFPQAGTVTVGGARVTRPVRIAGMAFQAPTLLPWRTTRDNVLLPLEIVQPYRSAMRRKRAEFAAKADALLASVGLEGAGDKYPWQLSGMLDEPFGALDAFTREELWCVIRDLHAASGVTIVLVTHDLREATFLADRIFVMSARPGRVIAERAVDFARPRDLELTFTPAFQDVVHELRAHIVEARG